MKLFNAMFSKVNGGLEQVFLKYTTALIGQGNQVIPIIHPQAEILPECPPEHLVTCHNYNAYDPFALLRLRKLIAQEQPDCIITHSYRAAYLFNKTKTRVPKVAICHVRGHYNFGSDAIIALTETMRQDIIAAGIPAYTVFTVPNMIDLPQDLVYKKPRDTDIPTIGICARLTSIKGIDVFINALAELKKRNIPFKAQIAGDGKERATYAKLIHSHQLEQQVSLLGWVQDTSSFYKNLDVFCLPSREEAFGMVLLESMVHSLPLVVTETAGPLEVIGKSESALFVPTDDSVSMANALERIIINPELAEQLGHNGFNRVQRFTTPNIAPILQEALTTICKQQH